MKIVRKTNLSQLFGSPIRFWQLTLLLTSMLWTVAILPLPQRVNAETVLTRAVIESIRNLVRLIPQNSQARSAHVSDAMNPGDALSTGQSSLAELRFNDGSLARVGEQAVFRFLPNTRNFKLSNGTVLLLIPPGRGTTNLRTPNAAATIRGSALFVRYIPETNTTVVGALTNSGIEVFNQGASQSQVLKAGQLAVIVQDKIQSLYDFDLRTFYETSDMVRGLELEHSDKVTHFPDPALASVRAETSAAVKQSIIGPDVVEKPNFTRSQLGL